MIVLKYHWPNDRLNQSNKKDYEHKYGRFKMRKEDNLRHGIKRFSKIQVHGNKPKKQNKTKKSNWAAEMVQQLRACTTLTEDLTSVHSTHKVAHN